MRITLLLAASLVASLTSWAVGQAYPRPELLMEAAALAKPEVARQFIILDVRERKQYDQGHVPEARWVDHAAWAKSFGDGADAAGWSRRLGDLGLRGSSRIIVVYDDNSLRDACRVWWILRYWGFEDVRLLDGGWSGWKAGNYPVQTEAPKAASPVDLALKPRSERLVTKGQLLQAIKDQSLQIIDARSEGEYAGTQKLSKRGGAMPGARHLEWLEVIDPKTQRFKQPMELERIFQEKGIDLKKPLCSH